MDAEIKKVLEDLKKTIIDATKNLATKDELNSAVKNLATKDELKKIEKRMVKMEKNILEYIEYVDKGLAEHRHDTEVHLAIHKN